jgi:hypothetical protein
MTRRKKRAPLEPSTLVVELAAGDDPPTELASYMGRLRNAGAIELYVGTRSDRGAFFEITSAEQARTGDAFVMTRSQLLLASWQIDWQSSSAPMRDALDKLIDEFVGYDRIARLRFAESDMRLAAHAAAGLIEARDQRGSARIFERVIETGMVVTYARPFLPSNHAGLGEDWWPKDDAGRELHEQLVDLRGEYHAHAEHTPQRRLDFLPGFTQSGRPMLNESWTQLQSTSCACSRRSPSARPSGSRPRPSGSTSSCSGRAKSRNRTDACRNAAPPPSTSPACLRDTTYDVCTSASGISVWVRSMHVSVIAKACANSSY